jgi:acyl-CoA synthetase (NDP forming)/RimJ/RimL family protein N-acetyltransferase
MAEGGHYPEYWEADVVLRDGGTAHLRPIGPDDAKAIQAFHQQQSPHSVYLRFFSFKASLSAAELSRFTEVDHQNRVAFVAARGDEIIGVGRYDRLDDPAEAEVAFNISDRYQGRGVGSILLEHLAAAARENGIRRFSAEVLPENRKMIDVFADAGYETSRAFDDGVVAVRFDIDPTHRSREVMAAREHRAEARSVAELMTPSSIAVVCAGREHGTVGQSILQHVLDGGYRGRLCAVGAAEAELPGVHYSGSLGELPGSVDLAIIAVPYEDVSQVVDECAKAGVRGVVIATAGFADAGAPGLARQRELVRQARLNGMRLVGPASLGLINTDPGVQLNASLVPALPRAGGLALFSQSAALGLMLHAAAFRRSLGVSSLISAGNRADVSGNDAMQYWEDDDATTVVGLYLESIGNPRKFSRIARRLSQRKPVIVAKSDVMGLKLPPGHAVRTTQAPAGALDAMLRQSGVIRVGTIEQLMDTAQILAAQPLPAGPGVAVVSNSRALGKVVADAAAAHRLDVVRLATEFGVHAEDGTTEPASGAGAAPGLPDVRRTVSQALAGSSVHAAVVTLLPVPGLPSADIAAVLRDCATEAGKPLAAVFTGALDNSATTALIRPSEQRGTGLPCYASPGAAVAALAAVVQYAQWRARSHGEYAEPPDIEPDAAGKYLEGILGRVRGDALTRLDGAESAALLGCYGIGLLPSAPFSSAAEAVAAAERFGWPVALKSTEERLRHRLDLGGVRLNITDGASLRRNISRMASELEPYGAAGMEVQPMARAGQACTLRAIEDPLLGPVFSFGLAGDAVNLLDDWAHSTPPLTGVDAAELVRAPRAARKLFGYQGLPAADTAALEDLVGRVAALKDRHPEVALLELNPVLVATQGLAVLGADIRVGNPQQRTDSARRAMLG